MAAPSFFTLRYMTRFRCTGGECIDTCCAGWKVLIDEGHYVQLSKRLATTPDDAAVFDARVPLLPLAQRTASAHARFHMEGSEPCPYLAPQGLCGIQMAHGAEILPDICAEYPRSTTLASAGSELTGFPSCPEVARLMLFERDATDVVKLAPGALGKSRPIGIVKLDPRAEPIAMVLRAALMELASRDDYAIESRLFFVAAAGLRLGPVFAAPLLDPDAVDAMLTELRSEPVLTMLDEARRTHGLGTGFALETIVRCLGLRGSGEKQPRFRQFMQAWLSGLAVRSDGAVTASPAGFDLDAERLFAFYEPRRAALRETFGELLALTVRNRLRHSFFSEVSILASRELSMLVLSFVVREAMLRVLVVLHPETDAAVASRDEAALRGIVQQCVYVLARGLEHNAELVTAHRAAVEDRVRNLAEAAGVVGLL